jgi:methionyl-tRNA synthetase
VAPGASQGPAPHFEPTTLTSASGVPTVAPPVPAGPIPAEALARIELRVGVITSAARVPRKDKLLDLRVDVGDEAGPRRIVAGLAQSFGPEDLVGKRVVVACNLEPRDFGKGLVSHGMILAAGPSDGLGLCTVDRDVPPGTRVK